MVEEVVEALKRSPHWEKVRRWAEELKGEWEKLRKSFKSYKKEEFARMVAQKVLSKEAEDVIDWIVDSWERTLRKFSSPHRALFSALWYLVMKENPNVKYREFAGVDGLVYHLYNTLKRGISGDELLEMIKEYAEKNPIKRVVITESGDFVEQSVPMDPFKAYIELFYGSRRGSFSGRSNKDTSNALSVVFSTESGVWSEHHWRIFKRLVKLAEKCLETKWCTHERYYYRK